MTTEQREAIDRLKDDIKYADMRDTVDDDCTICFIDDLDTVLSLIKENQTEIEKYKALYDRALSDVVKADKQIDLMAEEIIMTKPANCTRTNEFNTEKVYMSKEEIKEYFERKVEDVKD